MEREVTDSESDDVEDVEDVDIDHRIKENKLLKNLKYDYEQFEIRDFYDLYLQKKNKINFKPVYQRSFSWNKDKQNLFIDSIIHNYIIPPIILIKLENEEYEYECIDGQHRLCVIKHFIESTPIDLDRPHFIRYKKIDKDRNKNHNVLYDEKERIKIPYK